MRELIAQNHAELVGLWRDAPAGIYSAGLGRRDLGARILFAGIQSIHRRAYDVQQCDLVLIDEAHLIPAASDTMYRRFLEGLTRINPALKVIGFTATPYRLDSGMLHEGKGALFLDHLGGNKIASGAGLLSALHRQPALLMQIDEFGMFLTAAADRKRSPRHITEILDNMTELYTAAGGVFLGAEYANHDGKNARRDIVQPCLCVYGTTTPVHFWGALQSANVVDGSLARFIIVETEEDYPEETEGRGIRQAPPALVEALKLVARGGGHAPSGNIASLGTGLTTAVEPMIVPMTVPARDAFRALGAEVTCRLRDARGTRHTAILARIGENAAKLALVAAVGRDPVAPRIDLAEAEWAIDFVLHFAGRTMRAVERHVADNETERNHKRVLEIIRSAGPGGISKTDVTRRSQFLEKRARDEILDTLTVTGLITSRNRNSATKPGLVLVAVEEGAP